MKPTDQINAESVSLAQLLDEVQPMIITEREKGRNPKYIKLHPVWFNEVMKCKKEEVSRGTPIMVLGLEIDQSEDILMGKPELY